MARSILLTVIGIALVTGQTACAAATVPSRLQAYYWGIPDFRSRRTDSALDQSRSGWFPANHRPTAEGAAPALPDEAQTRLTEQLKERLGQSLPLTVETLLPAEGIQPKGDLSPLLELAQPHDVDYLLVIVASATEQEYPYSVFLGWHSDNQPGLRRDNWSLLETALIDVKTEVVLLRGEDGA